MLWIDNGTIVMPTVNYTIALKIFTIVSAFLF